MPQCSKVKFLTESSARENLNCMLRSPSVPLDSKKKLNTYQCQGMWFLARWQVSMEEV